MNTFRRLALLAALPLAISLAAAEIDAETLAKESEARCVATAKDKATAELLTKKVDEAAALLAKEGPACFAKLKGKDSAFLFAGTYIWIHDERGVMLCHPLKWKMEGKPMIELTDTKGKKLFVEMNRIAETKGQGWIEYWWPKPGEKAPSYKVSYVKKVDKPEKDGKYFVVGCGTYDLNEAEGAKLADGK